MAPRPAPARPGRGNLRNKANDIELASLHGTTTEVKKAKSSREEFQQIAKIFGFMNVVAGLSCVVAGAVLIPLGLVQFCIEIVGHTRLGTSINRVECDPDTPLSSRHTSNFGEGIWCGLWILIGGAVSVLVGVKPPSTCRISLLFNFTSFGSACSIVLIILELYQVQFAQNVLTVGLLVTNAALSFLALIFSIVTLVCTFRFQC